MVELELGFRLLDIKVYGDRIKGNFISLLVLFVRIKLSYKRELE